MTVEKITRVAFVVSLAALLPAFVAMSGGQPAAAHPQAERSAPHCTPIGGMIMTNVGGFGPNTTMGTVTGDLRGAVGVEIQSVTQGSGNTTLFHVLHHWVTESGDTLTIDHATATTTQVAPGLFAILNYPVHLSGGTGKFAGATGDLTGIIGEVDLNAGRLVLRYSGEVCLAAAD
jgi:hypothetical protein